jgi:hypothetical protein
MMMTTIDRGRIALLAGILALSGAGNLYGQQKDFQSWYELELNAGLKNGIDLSLEAEQRFENNSLQYDRSVLTLSADYDLTGWFNAALGVRGLVRMNRERRLMPQYRIHADATLEHDISVFDCSLRSRLQYGFDEMDILRDAGGSKLVSRNRLEAKHHIFGTRIDVSASVESWHLLSGSPLRSFYKMRYSAGIGYMLGFRSDVSLRYILEDEFNVTDPLQSHILVVGFSYDF